jgi:two-component system, LytTR family, response regulator
MKTIIIDDIKNARAALKADIEDYCPNLSLIGEADSVASGLEEIIKLKPDLVFLDVQMNDGTGFDLLKKLAENNVNQPYVIFTTAYDQYAIQAFQFSAIDYLLKPIDFQLLQKSVEKAGKMAKVSYIMLENFQKNDYETKRIVVNRHDKELVFSIKDIVSFESDGAYTEILTLNGKKELASKNLKSFEILLQEYGFLRVHHSFLINSKMIENFDKNKMFVKMKTGVEIPVSQRKKEVLLSLS